MFVVVVLIFFEGEVEGEGGGARGMCWSYLRAVGVYEWCFGLDRGFLGSAGVEDVGPLCRFSGAGFELRLGGGLVVFKVNGDEGVTTFIQ